jgi:hypothetical protein
MLLVLLFFVVLVLSQIFWLLAIMRRPSLMQLLVLLLIFTGAGGLPLLCEELVVVSPSSSSLSSSTRTTLHQGGFSPSCFEKKTVTFDTCKRLLFLRRKHGCSALTYTHSSCSLHDRSLSSWKPIIFNQTAHTTTPLLQMLLLSSPSDSCTPPLATHSLHDHSDTQRLSDPSSSPSSKSVLPACFQHSRLAPLPPTSPDRVTDSGDDRKIPPGLHHWLTLPRLGIVMAVTSDWLNTNRKEINSLVDNWECYARTHNYNFVSYVILYHIYVDVDIISDYGFFIVVVYCVVAASICKY